MSDGGAQETAQAPAKAVDTKVAASGKPPAQSVDKVIPKSVGTDAQEKPVETVAEKKARTLKIKVNGKESDIDIDSMADDELSMKLQLAEAARVRMQETAELKKQFAEFQKAVKDNPWEALKDPAFGLDLDKLAEERILQRYQEEMMPEQERKVMEYEKKLKEYESRDAAAKAAKEQELVARAQAKMEEQAFEEIQRDFTAALEKGNLPRTPQVMAMMAEVAQINLQHGLELTPAQMAYEVRERLANQQKHFTGNLKGQELADFLGDAVVREVLQYSIAKAKGKIAPNTKAVEEQDEPLQKYDDADEDLFDRKTATKRRQRALDAKEFFRKMR
jgi:hypothetical protein